jgi:hypothetical protein
MLKNTLSGKTQKGNSFISNISLYESKMGNIYALLTTATKKDLLIKIMKIQSETVNTKAN